MAIDNLELVISNPGEGKFLKEISWNKEEFKNQVAAITEQYHGLSYTDDQMKAAKKDRADLNSLKKAINQRRIDVKKAIMEPYNAFEADVKEVVDLIDQQIAMIDKQIKEYEEHEKEEKRIEIEKYFNSAVSANTELQNNVVSFDSIFKREWLNASVTVKKAQKEIDALLEQICADIKSIEELCEDKYVAIIKNHYLINARFDISKAMSEYRRLKDIDQKAEEERIRKEEAKKRREAELKAQKEAALQAEREAREAAELRAQQEAEARRMLEINQEKPVAELEKPVEREELVADARANESESIQSEIPQQKEPDADKPVHVQEPQEPEKTYRSSFTVYGTKEQIYSVRQFMIDNNIRYGKVEK